MHLADGVLGVAQDGAFGQLQLDQARGNLVQFEDVRQGTDEIGIFEL